MKRLKQGIIIIPVLIFFLVLGLIGYFVYHNYQTNKQDKRCLLTPDPGTCKAYIPRYYYDQQEKICKEFIWGGCEGTVPFVSLQECLNVCNSSKDNYDFEDKVKKCTGDRYIDDEVNFSIECPSNLNISSISTIETNRDGMDKIVYFCEQDYEWDGENIYEGCPTGGILIWANGSGWGGGCDAKNWTEINIDEQNIKYCLFENDGFGHLTITNLKTDDVYLIEGSFSDSFTKAVALNMLRSFKMLSE